MLDKKFGYGYSFLIFLWSCIFFAVPLVIILVYSFLGRGLYGGVIYRFSLDGYRMLANPNLIHTFWLTLAMASVATFLMIALAIPCAYFIVRSPHKNFWLFLVIVPFWTNFLIRIYAWIAVLGNNGFLNQFLVHIGLIRDYIQFLYNPYAVILVMVYTYLPFAIFPLYANMEKFDFSLLEAARDLGAKKFQAIFKVLIPNIKIGLVSAILFSFIPCFGTYAIPLLVGGEHSYMLGNIIARELTITRNWPLAASISTILILLTLMSILVIVYLNRSRSRSDLAKG